MIYHDGLDTMEQGCVGLRMEIEGLRQGGGVERRWRGEGVLWEERGGGHCGTRLKAAVT